MAKKKKSQSKKSKPAKKPVETSASNPEQQPQSLPDVASSAQEQSGGLAQNTTATNEQTEQSPSSPLEITRNKHWRYISAFHGPWLQMPTESLDDLAHTNYSSNPPRPIDAAVFYNIIKIKSLVEEATSLAHRAMTGDGIAAQGNKKVFGGSHMKISRERQRRMRELAIQKLAQAYCIDEIAATVVAMQHASILDGLADLVLQRNNNYLDAKYVHFFHEKIPSRLFDENTNLVALDELVAQRPGELGHLRTRAVTKMFKHDLHGAARDLTDGINILKFRKTHQRPTTGSAHSAQSRFHHAPHKKIGEDEQPSSMENQFLFHRASVYLAIAVQNVREATIVRGQCYEEFMFGGKPEGVNADDDIDSEEAFQKRWEACKAVKAYARRALRDYLSFLSNFNYMLGITSAVRDKLFLQVGKAMQSKPEERDPYVDNLLKDMKLPKIPEASKSSEQHASGNGEDEQNILAPTLPNLDDNGFDWTPVAVNKISNLLSLNPLFQFPPGVTDGMSETASKKIHLCRDEYLLDDLHSIEAVTYHPLLPEALHSVLLCHALLQTPIKEIRRYAHNVAELIRVCEGYPLFLSARSPSRADWMELLKLSDNWIELEHSWKVLCALRPASDDHPFRRTYEGAHISAGLSREAPNVTALIYRQAARREAIIASFGARGIEDAETLLDYVRNKELDIFEYFVRRANQVNASSPEPQEEDDWVPDEPEKRDSCFDGERGAVIACWVSHAPDPQALDEASRIDRAAKRQTKGKGLARGARPPQKGRSSLHPGQGVGGSSASAQPKPKRKDKEANPPSYAEAAAGIRKNLEGLNLNGN
ncbi:hypothetical protein L228DRAFT_264829 [Xylona heveae TC161]|uniref:Uncharacterized protein n=1 Tax=Xylona heveae (strain CBS 132557 / TC161) TaxID=1328760 RepID=A0A165JMT4_XYLHT|nr:hypothetical protein L228DRAFT_264829 [Xylona heveae TC161]KZF26432.1 hypothetical protein L228DRAFT_264829 [Xylona heveae TC161]